MKKDRISFLRLISELENDLEILSGLMQKYKLVNNKIKRIKPDEFDWASLGYTIHNIYNLIENYLLRISKFFGNNLDPSYWHKDLVNLMTIEIEDVRPRLFDRKLANDINELRAFRHIFRYIYQSELDVEKLQAMNIKVPAIIINFKKSHEQFIRKLRTILAAL